MRRLLTGLLVWLLAACAPQPQESLPPLSVTGTDGRPTVLAPGPQRFTLINVWAPWCPPCVAEMPSLDRLAGLAPELRVVGLAPDQNRLLADEFLRKHGIRFPTYFGSEDLITNTLGVQVFPVTLLVAPDGRVLARAAGAREWDSAATRDWLQAMIERARG
ncbi:MAG: TlpA disulfide reductase family protein [Candidatus Competibacterales bacterium]|nr:TlpA disulfide reductase family protein [Candidatus Competibacterales bacterium]